MRLQLAVMATVLLCWSSAALAAPTPVAATRPQILVLGDTLAANGGQKDGWVKQLEHAYGSAASVTNYGQADAKAADVVTQLQQVLAERYPTKADADSIAYVVVALGTNDARSAANTAAAAGGVDGSTHAAFDAFEDQLATLVKLLQARGVEDVVLVTPPPIAADATVVNGFTNAVDSVAAAKKLPLVDLYTSVAAMPHWRPRAFKSDDELTLLGHEVLYKELADNIKVQLPQLTAAALAADPQALPNHRAAMAAAAAEAAAAAAKEKAQEKAEEEQKMAGKAAAASADVGVAAAGVAGADEAELPELRHPIKQWVHPHAAVSIAAVERADESIDEDISEGSGIARAAEAMQLQNGKEHKQADKEPVAQKQEPQPAGGKAAEPAVPTKPAQNTSDTTSNSADDTDDDDDDEAKKRKKAGVSAPDDELVEGLISGDIPEEEPAVAVSKATEDPIADKPAAAAAHGTFGSSSGSSSGSNAEQPPPSTSGSTTVPQVHNTLGRVPGVKDIPSTFGGSSPAAAPKQQQQQQQPAAGSGAGAADAQPAAPALQAASGGAVKADQSASGRSSGIGTAQEPAPATFGSTVPQPPVTEHKPNGLPVLPMPDNKPNQLSKEGDRQNKAEPSQKSQATPAISVTFGSVSASSIAGTGTQDSSSTTGSTLAVKEDLPKLQDSRHAAQHSTFGTNSGSSSTSSPAGSSNAADMQAAIKELEQQAAALKREREQPQQAQHEVQQEQQELQDPEMAEAMVDAIVDASKQDAAGVEAQDHTSEGTHYQHEEQEEEEQEEERENDDHGRHSDDMKHRHSRHQHHGHGRDGGHPRRHSGSGSGSSSSRGERRHYHDVDDDSDDQHRGYHNGSSSSKHHERRYHEHNEDDMEYSEEERVQYVHSNPGRHTHKHKRDHDDAAHVNAAILDLHDVKESQPQRQRATSAAESQAAISSNSKLQPSSAVATTFSTPALPHQQPQNDLKQQKLHGADAAASATTAATAAADKVAAARAAAAEEADHTLAALDAASLSHAGSDITAAVSGAEDDGKRPLIVAVGDYVMRQGSFGTGIVAPSNDAGGWISRLAAAYGAKAQVVNKAQATATSKDGLSMVDDLMRDYAGAAGRIKLAVLSFGGNDAITRGAGDDAQVSLAAYKSNLEEMVAKLLQAGVKDVLIVTPPPAARRAERRFRLVRQYATAAQEAAQKAWEAAAAGKASAAQDVRVQTVDLFSAVATLKAWQQHALKEDGLRLSERGQQLLYKRVMKVLSTKLPAVSPAGLKST